MNATPLTAPSSNRDPAHPINPAPEFARLRAEKPVMQVQRQFPDGQLLTTWLITNHEYVREVLGSPHTSNSFSSGDNGTSQPGFLLSLDPPDHTRIRRMLTREFTVKRINSLRPRVEEIVTGFLDDLVAAGPPADLMQHFALPVPSLVICELLGVPYEDRADFQRRSDVLLDPTAGPDRQRENSREMNDYMTELIARHRTNPGDDILGMLIREHADNLTDEELLGIGNILLIAGHETTANTIGLGTLLLTQHPDQLAMVRDDPAVLRTAVEEILRFLSIVHSGSPRLVTEDITIGGVQIAAGELVVVSLPSANRDPEFLHDADVFDVQRAPGPHLTFGHGIHQCLGQQLARMEMSVAFPALLNRLPDLRITAPESELTFRPLGPVNGVRALPITWG
ncbi:cytochrome P450 [Amycolatopsis ultiminotia]|uniref:Cytochrome P450 n=1 Tax=Amycolatopsis ultiminotia TaxID=543629 RepID=A0ABP6V4L3_9PSEU